jgi:hypothetical protein
MVELPPGWRVKNINGSFAGPPPLDDHQTTSADEDEDEHNGDEIGGLDIRPDSPGWEDIEPDTEALSVQCLLCPESHPSPTLMLAHCKEQHNFDFAATIRSHELDFYHTIKYVNLIRSNVQNAVEDPTAINPASLESDDLLKPTLENDALLFSLDDIIDFESSAVDSS